MDDVPPIYINDTGGGHVTVTLVQGDNNKVDVGIDQFSESLFKECGLHLLHKSHFQQHSDTSENFNDWLKGFPFLKESIYYQREYRREKVISEIKQILEEKKNLLILGESGTSKSTLIMEVLTDYLKNDIKILYNLEPGDGEIENIKYIENKIEGLVNGGNDILVVVDDVHNQAKSLIFSLIKNLQTLDMQKRKKIRFLLSARQPEFTWAMERGLFDTQIIQTIESLFDNTRKYEIPDFTENEIVGFIEKYKDNVHFLKRNKNIADFAHEIFEDTKGHPIMVRFSVIQDGLKTHVEKMYRDYLLTNTGTTSSNYPNVERIKSVIACSLYHISSLPIGNFILFDQMNLKKPSLEINGTLIQRTGDTWKTIHPRWDLEMFKHLFSLNERDRIEIEDAFKSIFLKVIDLEKGHLNQLLILNSVYNTIAAKKFINIDLILGLIKLEEIENKLDNYSKIRFLAKIIGIALYDLGRNEEAVASFDKAIEIDPQYAKSYINKGTVLSALGRNEDAIKCYDKAIKIDPEFAKAYINKGTVLSALGRKEEAIASFDKAIEINPQYAEAYINKGRNLLELGRYKEVIVCYDKAIEINPEYALAHNNKGSALLGLGKKEEAIVRYDKALAIDPNYNDAINGKAFALANLGKNEEALTLIQKLLESHSNNEYYLSTAAFIMYNLKRYAESKNYYNKALGINPNLKDTLSESELKTFNSVME